MKKLFVFGQSVAGDNFTDREKETSRLKMNFTHGVNTILISPRRIGKTSLVMKVLSELDREDIIPVFFDMYDCRDEYDFYNKFSAAVLKATSSSMDTLMRNISEFLGRVTPKISVSPDPSADYSLSLGLTPRQYAPEEVLSLPQRIAAKRQKHIVVCIDEFQQIGEWPDSITVQKTMRGVWQHCQDVTFCFFGSKKHMMEKIFGDRSMPFYQFGEMTELERIPTEIWVKYISSRFEKEGKSIPEDIAVRLCQSVGNYSSYVQQLSWNLFVLTDKVATKEDLDEALDDTLSQNNSFFTEQIKDLTAYQLNFLKAIACGLHSGFTSAKVLSEWHMGAKSNISIIKKTLTDKELIDVKNGEIVLSDPVFEIWLKRNCN